MKSKIQNVVCPKCGRPPTPEMLKLLRCFWCGCDFRAEAEKYLKKK